MKAETLALRAPHPHQATIDAESALGNSPHIQDAYRHIRYYLLSHNNKLRQRRVS